MTCARGSGSTAATARYRSSRRRRSRKQLGGQIRLGAKSASRMRMNWPMSRKSVPQVAGFLHRAMVRPRDPAEPEVVGHDPHSLVRSVVENVGGRGAGVRPEELEDVSPRVVPARRAARRRRARTLQGWIAARTPPRRRARGAPPGRILGAEVNAQGDDVVADGEHQKRQEHPCEQGVQEHEPGLADQQGAEAGQRGTDDQARLPLE